MNSLTNAKRLHIRLLAIGIMAMIAGPVLADPAPDLVNTMQAMRKEASAAGADKGRSVSAGVGAGETKGEAFAKVINVPASQGVSSVTVFIRPGERTEPREFDVAPLK